GDMNSSPAWPVYKAMRRRWADLAVEASPEPEPTWAWRPGWRRMLRIDHVFGSGVTAETTGVHAVAGSDHHALVVDVALSPR
ncbi:MAG: endonuclease/exonuclease/phosphatase family protein, partial [Acidimicrobiia bacterium]|nr:endonuclease/exonuclease/phosphatase family protein [Acidimicrobiia bacterium]